MNLRDLIAAQKVESFTDPGNATDEDAVGILVAHYFEWDGAAICRAFAAALEDANFHPESEVALGMVPS